MQAGRARPVGVFTPLTAENAACQVSAPGTVMGPSPGASLARWVSAWLAPELPGVFQVGRPGPSTNQLNQGLGTGDGAAALIRPCGSDVQRTLRTKTGTSSSEPFTPSGLEGWADSDRVPKSEVRFPGGAGSVRGAGRGCSVIGESLSGPQTSLWFQAQAFTRHLTGSLSPGQYAASWKLWPQGGVA